MAIVAAVTKKIVVGLVPDHAIVEDQEPDHATEGVVGETEVAAENATDVVIDVVGEVLPDHPAVIVVASVHAIEIAIRNHLATRIIPIQI